MRILLVGVGRWGEKHLRVLRELGVDVWVAEASAERRRWVTGQGVARDRVVADYRRALEAVDAVDVVTPVQSHAEIALAALAAGRHCFVEKPLASTASEAAAVAAEAVRNAFMGVLPVDAGTVPIGRAPRIRPAAPSDGIGLARVEYECNDSLHSSA